METNQKIDREKRRGPREGTAKGRGAKTETVVILVVAAFFLGLIVGALVALLKTPPLQETRQVPPSGQRKMSLVSEMDFSQEIQMHEGLVQKDPENPDAWVHLGDLFSKIQQYDKAIEAYAKALNIQPANADILVKLGNAHFDREAYEKAIGAYSKALAIDTRNADVLTDLGIAYRRTKKPKKALDAFRKAAQIDASHSMSRYNQGVVLFHDLNDAEGAMKAWQEFLQIEPSGERAERVKRMVETLRNMSSAPE